MREPPSTETIALWILAALKIEYEREPSLLKARLFREVIAPTMQKHRLESGDIDRGLHFLLDEKCLQAVNRDDGRAVLPSTKGLQYLSANQEREKAKTTWTFERRFALYALIVAMVGILCTLALKYWL